MFNLSKFSEQLTELMAMHNFNQTTLATAMNTKRPKLSSYLSAKRAPDYEFFVALIDFFHCSADFLLGLKEYPDDTVEYKPVQPFGARLRTVLEEFGISQYAFQRDTKISWSIIHSWLISKSKPSMAHLVCIAEYVKCSADYLLGRV